MSANYNNSAWFYDRLSRLVYGKALVNAQVYLLAFIKPNCSVLIVGGGTGWILEEITKIHPAGLQVTYIEVASNMIALSKKRNTGSNEVRFINDAVEKVSGLGTFDVVITPFLFDNFTADNQEKIFNHLNTMLNTNGSWLNTDFQLTRKLWQNLLLKTMILFFKVWCGIESTGLNDIKPHFINAGYKVLAHQTFFGDFVIAEAYQRRA